MKTSSCNANIFSKHQDIQKYIPLEIIKGDYIADTKGNYGQTLKNYEANIELNNETIGTFFTQWYFYHDNQFGMNFFNLNAKGINQIPLGKDGDLFLKVVNIGGDYMLSTCNKNGTRDNNSFFIEKKYFPTLEKSDLRQYENETVSFVIKKGQVMKDKADEEIKVNDKNFFAADVYRVDDQTKPIGELYCNYGIYVDVSPDSSGFLYQYWPTMSRASMSMPSDDNALVLLNGSSEQYPYFLGLSNAQGEIFGVAGIGHVDKVDDIKKLFNTEKNVCENSSSTTIYSMEPEYLTTNALINI